MLGLWAELRNHGVPNTNQESQAAAVKSCVSVSTAVPTFAVNKILFISQQLDIMSLF
jgi:hypothetical protein